MSNSGTSVSVVPLLYNLIGYGSIFLPLYGLAAYFRRQKNSMVRYSGKVAWLVETCFVGKKPPSEEIECGNGDRHSHHHRNGLVQNSAAPVQVSNYFLMVFCFFGLQICYLTAGILQERIMTNNYPGMSSDVPSARFQQSEFVVFLNCSVGGLLAVSILQLIRMIQRHRYWRQLLKSDDEEETKLVLSNRAPLLEYSYSSLSNILSAWCQYEVLKFVSFPTQVLVKASKVIPVMLMGLFVMGKRYTTRDYCTAVMISAGVATFLLTTQHRPLKPVEDEIEGMDSNQTFVESINGILLLAGYILFDSFTSNWQEKLYSHYRISSLHMMAGSNFWSSLLTFCSLFEQRTLSAALLFIAQRPGFLRDAGLLSLASAVGQLFIYFTIGRFGAASFVLMMTVRQVLSILLSCLIYGHKISTLGFVGVCVVFAALFIRIALATRRGHTSTNQK